MNRNPSFGIADEADIDPLRNPHREWMRAVPRYKRGKKGSGGWWFTCRANVRRSRRRWLRKYFDVRTCAWCARAKFSWQMPAGQEVCKRCRGGRSNE